MTEEEILVVTPIGHLLGVRERLEPAGNVTLRENAQLGELTDELAKATAVFTNPNKATFFMGREFFDLAPNLKVICTASTGTNHIDLELASQRGVDILSLRDEKDLLRQISSTAELAVTLTLASLRNLIPAVAAVARGEWDYEPYIGRQLSALTVGVVGLGRLGSMYADFMRPLAKRVVYYDPFVEEASFPERCTSLGQIFGVSDVVSFHVHPGKGTFQMVNAETLRHAKKNVVLVNTARGEILHEEALVDFLKANPRSSVAVDVLTDETMRKDSSPLRAFSKISEQVIITPHIGGMTVEGQNLAFQTAASMLQEFLSAAVGSE